MTLAAICVALALSRFLLSFHRDNYEPIEKPTKSKRRTHADNQELAQPKPGVRFRSEQVLNWARRRGLCEVCCRRLKTEPLHVKTRGSGGGDELSNVVAGCRECHNRTQDAGDAGVAELKAAIARRIDSLIAEELAGVRRA